MWTVIADIVSFDKISDKFRTYKERFKLNNVPVRSQRANLKSTTSAVHTCNRRQVLPPTGCGSWIFLQTFQWTKHHECDRSLQRQIVFFCLYTKNGLSHYIAELGSRHFFSVYQHVCGVSVEDHAAIVCWKTIAPFMYDTYHHADVLSCRRLTEQYVDIVKICISVEEHAVGHEFETNEGSIRIQAFSKLVRKIVPLPIYGEQLMCYVKGDVYLTGILKYFFIRQVFNDTGVRLGSTQYEDVQRRLESCRRLQDGFDVSIDAFSLQLADAGYFLTNDSKLAQCFKCGGVLQLKQFDFDPWEDHAYWHPSCPFLLEAKGQGFVDKVRLELRQKCDFNSECVFTFKLRKLAPAERPDSDSCDESDEYNENDDDDFFGTDSPESDYFSDESD